MKATPEGLRTARSTVLFLGGLFGAMYEVVIDHTERPSILILLAGMMGLPAFLGKPVKPDPTPTKADPL